MKKEDYKFVATLLKMYCTPSTFPSSAWVVTSSGLEPDKVETEKNKQFWDGQLYMLKQCTTFLETYPEKLELINQLSQKL